MGTRDNTTRILVNRVLSLGDGRYNLTEDGGPRTHPRIAISLGGIAVGCTYVSRAAFEQLAKECKQFWESAEERVLQP